MKIKTIITILTIIILSVGCSKQMESSSVSQSGGDISSPPIVNSQSIVSSSTPTTAPIPTYQSYGKIGTYEYDHMFIDGDTFVTGKIIEENDWRSDSLNTKEYIVQNGAVLDTGDETVHGDLYEFILWNSEHEQIGTPLYLLDGWQVIYLEEEHQRVGGYNKISDPNSKYKIDTIGWLDNYWHAHEDFNRYEHIKKRAEFSENKIIIHIGGFHQVHLDFTNGEIFSKTTFTTEHLAEIMEIQKNEPEKYADSPMLETINASNDEKYTVYRFTQNTGTGRSPSIYLLHDHDKDILFPVFEDDFLFDFVFGEEGVIPWSVSYRHASNVYGVKAYSLEDGKEVTLPFVHKEMPLDYLAPLNLVYYDKEKAVYIIVYAAYQVPRGTEFNYATHYMDSVENPPNMTIDVYKEDGKLIFRKGISTNMHSLNATNDISFSPKMACEILETGELVLILTEGVQYSDENSGTLEIVIEEYRDI